MRGTSEVVIRSWVTPVEARSVARRSRYPCALAAGSAARPACSSERRAAARSSAVKRGRRELGEAGHLALALDPCGVVGGQLLDQARDPVADLKREVGRGGAGERTDVLDRDRAAGEAVLSL